MRTMLCFPLLVLMVSLAPAIASDPLPDLILANPGGVSQTLRQVTLMKVEPDGLRVMHSTGMTKVPFEALPPELQARYGFDPVKAKEHRAATAAANAAPANAAPASTAPPAADAPPATAAPGAGPAKPAGPVKLLTKEDVKAAWLAQCDSGILSSLDRDLGQKRAVMNERAAIIRSGKLDFLADKEAHETNAKALLAAGQTDAAAREQFAAVAAAAQQQAAVKRAEEAALLEGQKKAERERRRLMNGRAGGSMPGNGL